MSADNIMTKCIRLPSHVTKIKIYSNIELPLTVVVQCLAGHVEDDELFCHRSWDTAVHFFHVRDGMNVLCLCKLKGASYFNPPGSERLSVPVVLNIKSGAARAGNWDVAAWNSPTFYTDIYMSQLSMLDDLSYCATIHIFRIMPSPESLRALSLKSVCLSGVTLPVVAEVFSIRGVGYPFSPDALMVPSQKLLLACHHVRDNDGDLNEGDLCGLLFNASGHFNFLSSSSAVLNMPYMRDPLCMRYATLQLLNPSYAIFLSRFPLF